MANEKRNDLGLEKVTNASEAERVRVDDLQVSISLEIDSKTISIKELSDMAAGHIVTFSDKAPEKVKLFANDQYFADATLIMIEDQIAIRIERVV